MKQEQAEQIHRASLELLKDPGIRIEHDDILSALVDAGATLGKASHTVSIPQELIDKAIAMSPSSVLLADRREGGQEITPTGNTQIWSVPGMNILRHDEHRLFTSTDMADMARLVDQLPQINGVFGMAMADIQPTARDVVGLRIMALNTTKHIRVLCFTPGGAEALCEMRDVVDNSPWFSIGFTAHGPLRWTNLALEIFARTAGHRIPATINGEPMAGVSGPTTLAGSAAVGNAEILAGLVVNQILEPGRPCIYNLGLAHLFDMRTSIAVTGAPENHLFADISAAMGRFYDIPSCSWVSTESMCPDSQASMEKMAGFLTHLQSGVSLVWGAGQLESELTICPSQAVIDNEAIAYVRRYLRGVEINQESIAIDVTRAVGISGDFLATEHTMDHFRTEFFEPSLLLREKRATWEAAGSRPLHEEAELKADELINNERAPTLTEEQARALRQIEEDFIKTC